MPAAVPPDEGRGSAPPPDDLAEGALGALADYFRDPRRGTRDLREAVCAWVAALRIRGVPPHEVLARAKRLVEHARAESPRREPSGAAQEPRGEEPRYVTERVLRWCIEEYFRGRPPVE